jgi:DNA-binding CsgD family transcriptional regulator
VDAIRRSRDREPTGGWHPRINGRWTLIDAFNRGGERYIVARENQTFTPGLGALTEREQQVIASAAVGRSNKEIAYELGISYATVRVLIARACRRLGVRSRRELFELPVIRALRGEAPDPVDGGGRRTAAQSHRER